LKEAKDIHLKFYMCVHFLSLFILGLTSIWIFLYNFSLFVV